MLKIKLVLPILLILSVVMSGTVFANTEDPQVEADSPPYLSYLPLIFKPVPPPPAAPPAYYSTSWYVTPTSVLGNGMFNKGLQAAAITQPPGRQDQLLILDFGQPWGEDDQYGTLLLHEPEYDLASINDITTYTKQFIQGFMLANDGESKLELGIGTSNFAYYISGVCSPRSWFCTETRAYNHGKAWALMVKDVSNWVIQQGFAGQVSIAGANDIELAWNYATISHAWANGFNDYDQGVHIYYNYGACEGCDTSINLAVAPDPNKDLYYDWTPKKAHYTAWGVQPAWPIPEIYLTSGAHANQWANLSKVGVDLGYSKMYFLSAMTQLQACGGGCSYTDNTPVEAWYQLYNAINARPETAQSTIPYMTDIDWP